MADERFASYLAARRGDVPAGAHTGAAGGAACGDLVRLSFAVEGDRVRAAGAAAAGCGAALAAASAAAALVEGAPVLEAAQVSADAIAAELGGLSPGKRHAAELAADALHRALGAAVRADGAADAVDGRTLVAMSGGVDSAVAPLLCGRDKDAGAGPPQPRGAPPNTARPPCCPAPAGPFARGPPPG